MKDEMRHIDRCIELRCPKMAECSEEFCERTNDENWGKVVKNDN